MEAEANPAKADLEPRCRLCLQWIELNDGLVRHGDIFASGNGLSLKIRDCVGVFVAPEDSIRTICYNCQQTVCLIDDFRMLCRQTEEIYESVRICCKEGIKWDRFKEHVDELRLLLHEHKDVINGHLVEYDSEPEATDENSISNAFVPMMEVKEELEYDEEWEPDPIVGEFLEIKAECTDETEPEEKLNTDDDEDNNKSGHEYHKTIPIKLKLAIAEEVLNNPILWDTSQARSANIVGNTWKEIATKFDVDKKTIRARWRTLKSFYQHNRVRKADRHNTNAKYRKFMETMRSIIGTAGEDDNLKETEKPHETSGALNQSDENPLISKGRVKKAPPLSLHSLSKRMQLAQLVHKHQMLWNRKHTDFASAFAKDETWGTIAQQMKISREEAKYAWKNLRDLYRGRMKRVLKGQLDRDARLLKDPLFKLLDVMCADNMRIGTAPTVADKSLVTNEPDSNDTKEALEEESFAQTSNQDDSDGESERELDCSIEIKEETISSSDQSSFDLQIAFAEEILERLNESSQVDEASLCNEVGKHLQLTPATAKARWNMMKQNYIDNRARASSAGLQTRLRLQDCALFNLMNQIVPKLDHMEPYVAEEEETTVDRRRLPVESKIAIAEEIRRNPEIWNTSMACCSSTLEKVWIKVGNKFQMDADTIRNHWRALQGLSRTHARKERKGCTPTKDKKLCKLLGILRSMKYQAGGQNENPEETIVAKQESNSDEETDMPAAKDESQPKDNKPPKLSDLALGSDTKRMDLAQFVHKHEFLWNHKHPDFGNIILKDQTWDIVAASMNVTRDEIKYGWKCLRDLYRGRIKRVFNGNLPSNAPLLQDPLFKLLEVMCAKNMKIGAQSVIAKASKSADKNESESNDAGEEPEDAFSVKFDRNVKLQLISLVEQNDLIWNSENPEHLNLDKRDLIWDTIAEKMNFSKATVKALWTRLRNVYRGRKLRVMKGLMRQNSPLLREPVYAKLHKLLDGHMQLGKFTKTKKPVLRKGTEPMELGAAVETGPFATMEEKVRLVEEVIKHELLWNSNHDDFFKSDKRGAAWGQVAAMFENCEDHEVRFMWRKLRDMHRPRKTGNSRKTAEEDDEDDHYDTVNNPLYELFSKMAEKLIANDDSSQKPPKVGRHKLQEVTEAFMTHKCRYAGKRFFNDEGCIKLQRAGCVRYVRVCELCGKQIDRSMFEEHMNQHTGLRPYGCSYDGCDKHYSKKTTRDKHELLIHRQDNFKFTCDLCEQKFKYRSSYNYHNAVKHQSQQIPCPICGKLLRHPRLMSEHVKRHSSQFPCHVCGKVLQKKYSLTIHMRTHTNEQPYPCKLCTKRFMLKVQLKTHLSRVHQRAWEQYVETYGDGQG